jgi:hypothetical protein
MSSLIYSGAMPSAILGYMEFRDGRFNNRIERHD